MPAAHPAPPGADAVAVAMAPYDMNATDDWNPVGEWGGPPRLPRAAVAPLWSGRYRPCAAEKKRCGS
ncbi:hypothetical protein GCM10017687_64310 [Streptomyces echinatus]